MYRKCPKAAAENVVGYKSPESPELLELLLEAAGGVEPVHTRHNSLRGTLHGQQLLGGRQILARIPDAGPKVQHSHRFEGGAAVQN